VTLWAAEPTAPDRRRTVPAGGTTELVGCVIPWGEITVGRQLGAGGFGVVLAATWLGGDVAVKKICPELIASQGAAARSEFRRELELLCSLRHRHIVQCYGGDATDHFFVVTELMERGSLDDCLQSYPAEFAWARLGRRVLLDVAKGLLYLHGRGLVHFDVSRSARTYPPPDVVFFPLPVST
jgi:sterile alpha motif and leucine zipper-containing kinase AZK